MSPDSSETCTTNSGVEFRRSSVVGCYCLQALNEYVDSHGVFAGPAKLIEEQGDVCLDFALNYTLAQSLLLFAAGMVVFTNTALKIVLRRVTRFERHDTFTAQEHAIAIKVFLAQFLNTGLVVLIVNAKISSGLPDEVGLFAGEFKSFAPGWYSVVGVSIVITMTINIFAPHLLPVFHMLIACCKRTKSSFAKLVTQEQADLVRRRVVWCARHAPRLFVCLLVCVDVCACVCARVFLAVACAAVPSAGVFAVHTVPRRPQHRVCDVGVRRRPPHSHPHRLPVPRHVVLGGQSHAAAPVRQAAVHGGRLGAGACGCRLALCLLLVA